MVFSSFEQIASSMALVRILLLVARFMQMHLGASNCILVGERGPEVWITEDICVEIEHL